MNGNGNGFLRTITPEPWIFARKDVWLRMAADVVLVNSSLLLAALIHSAVQPSASGWHLSTKTLLSHSLIASPLALVIFHLHGFYSRTRGYATKYKIWVIVRAVTVFSALFFLADRVALQHEAWDGAALLAWAFLMLTVGGLRFAKEFFLRSYSIRSKRRPAKVERVLVVGGAGYLGSVLVSQLLERGYVTRVLDSFLYGSSSLDPLRHDPRLEVFTGDVRDIQAVVDAMRECDAVIHLAAIVGDPACEENRQLAVEVNRAATRMLIEIAKGYGIQRFLFASTCSVYGASDFLMDERTEVAPISTYAQTKVDSENLLLQARTPEFHPTILRLGTLFGISPRPRLDLVVNLLTARAATTGTITIFNGTQWRPFLHVGDAARAFVMCLESPPALCSGEIFNVGDYEMNYRLAQISEILSTIVPTVEVHHLDNTDRRNYRVSFDKIHSRLGFRCTKSLEEGVREIYNWTRSIELKDFSAAEFNNQAMVRAFAQTASAEHSTLRLLQSLSKCA
jgi:nucleoside-diphosphate-sugar epimerase